jgi:hypothetical protein
VTPLKKTVSRLTVTAYPCRGGERRQVIVSLLPGDVLSFRFKGMRSSFEFPVGDALACALRVHADAAVAAKRSRRNRYPVGSE